MHVSRSLCIVIIVCTVLSLAVLAEIFTYSKGMYLMHSQWYRDCLSQCLVW